MPVSLTALRQLLALNDRDPVARFALGNKLLQEASAPADLAEAAEHLAVAVELDERNVAAHYAHGQALAGLGRTDDARAALERGITLARTLSHGEGHDLLPILEEELANLDA
jgi:tetratricopeptide (TPR) repeat protein